MDIEGRVRGIVMEQLGATEAMVTLEAAFVGDLGADSLNVVEMTMALEEEFRIDIPDEEAEKLITVGQVVNYLTRRLPVP